MTTAQPSSIARGLLAVLLLSLLPGLATTQDEPAAVATSRPASLMERIAPVDPGRAALGRPTAGAGTRLQP